MAKQISIQIPHKLGKAKARDRVDANVGRLKDQLTSAGLNKVEHEWSGDQLQFKGKAIGQKITGQIEVGESDLKIDVKLPGLLSGFADTIREKLEEEGQRMLAEPSV